MIGLLLLALLSQGGVAAHAQSGTIKRSAPHAVNVRFGCQGLAPFTLSDIRSALEVAAQALPPPPVFNRSVAFSVPAIHTTPPSAGEVLREEAKRADARDQAALSVESTLAKIAAWEACVKNGGKVP